MTGKQGVCGYYKVHNYCGSFDYLTIGGQSDWVEDECQKAEADGYYLVGMTVSIHPTPLTVVSHVLMIGFDIPDWWTE